jgi:DNA-binding NarL/FixJ family response regulator
MSSIRVLIADDHPSFRQGMRQVCAPESALEVVGEVQNGLAHRLQPDAVLMNVEMPVLDGVEATQSITAQTPSPRVIALTGCPKDKRVFSAIRMGACLGLPRDAVEGDFIKAIRFAHRVEHRLGFA